MCNSTAVTVRTPFGIDVSMFFLACTNVLKRPTVLKVSHIGRLQVSLATKLASDTALVGNQKKRSQYPRYSASSDKSRHAKSCDSYGGLISCKVSVCIYM